MIVVVFVAVSAVTVVITADKWEKSNTQYEIETMYHMYVCILKLIQVICRVCGETATCQAVKATYSAKKAAIRKIKTQHKQNEQNFNGKMRLPCIHISMRFLAAYQFVVDCDVLGTRYSVHDYKCFHIFSIVEPSPEWIVVR